MTPRAVRTPSNTGPGSGSGPGLGPGPGSGPRPPPPPPPHYPTLSTGRSPGSPYAGSNSSGNSHGSGDSWARRRERDHDVNQLTRELWDTRRQLTAMRVREQAILDDLERLGERPESRDRNGVGSREALLRSEADVRAERARRLRAERALSDVERECTAPFVVPALFQAFMSISELS
ncbi:hypothetical protein L210DRAFT_864828 [Boletus edulis BED1]|uniref:Uncharacterized protein n=1 Tax=Boletus edulis BED1 TaxID=1328754 RepID=A0AAD4C030_BOLED|nr:hypothetical protein L210DRAFT_864828 [Boletus edulis BED1]